MKSGTVIGIGILALVITSVTIYQYSFYNNSTQTNSEEVRAQLELQFGSLVEFELDQQTEDISGIRIDAQCLESDATFELLGTLSKLRSLSLRHGRFKDDDLRPLSQLKQLTSVELQSLNFNGNGLQHLKQSKGIKSLKLSNNPVWSPKESIWLQEFPLLEHLELAFTDADDSTLAALTGHTELKTLVLDQTAVSSQGMEQLPNHPQLSHLSLRGCNLGKQNDDVFKEFITETPLILNLSKSTISDAALAHLKKLPLVQLDLSQTNVSDVGLQYLAGHEFLQQLDLSFTRCADQGLFETLPTLPLELLSLRGLQLSERVLQTLGNCDSLETLSLADTNVADSWLSELSNAMALEHLILYNTQVKGHELSSLAVLPGLSYLDLSNCPVDADGIRQLKSLTSLTSLELIGVPLNQQAIDHLVKIPLSHLNLSNSPIDGNDLRSLSAMQELKGLIIRNCSVTRFEFEMFQTRNTNCVIYWQEYGFDSTYAKPEAMQAMKIGR